MRGLLRIVLPYERDLRARRIGDCRVCASLFRGLGILGFCLRLFYFNTVSRIDFRIRRNSPIRRNLHYRICFAGSDRKAKRRGGLRIDFIERVFTDNYVRPTLIGFIDRYDAIALYRSFGRESSVGYRAKGNDAQQNTDHRRDQALRKRPFGYFFILAVK